MSRKTLRAIALLVAVLLIGIVACLAFLSYRQLQRATMKSQVAVLGVTLARFLEEGHLPADLPGYMSNLEDRGLFKRDNDERLIDPWGNQLKVEVDHLEGFYRVTVTSPGRDQILDTLDDHSRAFDANASLAPENLPYKATPNNSLPARRWRLNGD